MPDALALVGPTGVILLVFVCFSISVISCCQVLIVVSSLYSFDFYVLGDVGLTSYEPFTRTEQMSCVYYGRTEGEGCGHVKAIKAIFYWPIQVGASDVVYHICRCMSLSLHVCLGKIFNFG